MNEKKLKSSELQLINELFEMGGGFVLDFNNRTFAEFFADELKINIDDQRWYVEGSSKAKRLRFFLRRSSAAVVIGTLTALWEYREYNRKRSGTDETVSNAEELFYDIVERLGGSRPEPKPRPAKQAEVERLIDPEVSLKLKTDLLKISTLEPHNRGYAYERFLKRLFDANGLSGRAPFRNPGEQIDGSFELFGEIYLLEAKWQSKKIGVDDLRSFNAKVEDKASWSRGFFISDSGFTDVGLKAFGRGNRVVCMDGLDLYEMLDGNLSFAFVLSLKARRVAETGHPFVRIRDLSF